MGKSLVSIVSSYRLLRKYCLEHTVLEPHLFELSCTGYLLVFMGKSHFNIGNCNDPLVHYIDSHSSPTF